MGQLWHDIEVLVERNCEAAADCDARMGDYKLLSAEADSKCN